MTKHHTCTERTSATSIEAAARGLKQPSFQNVECRVIINDLLLPASIGIYPHERRNKQPLLISLSLTLLPVSLPTLPSILPPALPQASPTAVGEKSFLCYKELSEDIRRIVARGHIRLLEDLAETIAGCCFARPRAQSLWLRLEKPDALDDAKGAGIEVYFQRRQNEGQVQDAQKGKPKVKRGEQI